MHTLSTIAQDLFNPFLSYLTISEQLKVQMSCKMCRAIGMRSDFFKSILEKAQLLLSEKNENPQDNGNLALRIYKFLEVGNVPTTCAMVKAIVKMHPKYALRILINVLKSDPDNLDIKLNIINLNVLHPHSSISDRSLVQMIFSCKRELTLLTQNKKVEEQYNNLDIHLAILTAEQRCNEISSEEADSILRTSPTQQNNVYRVLLHVRYPSLAKITKDEMWAILSGSYPQKFDPQKFDLFRGDPESKLCMVLMHIHNTPSPLNDEIMSDLLYDVLHNEFALKKQKESARLIISEMLYFDRFHKSSKMLEDLTLGGKDYDLGLYNAFYSNATTKINRMKYSFFLSDLRMKKDTYLVNDEFAAQSFHAIFYCRDVLSVTYRTFSALNLVRMFLDERTFIIDDSAAADILLSIFYEQETPEHSKHTAILYYAELKLYKKLDIISSEQVRVLLEWIEFDDDRISPRIRITAIFYYAYMIFKKLIQRDHPSSDEQAFQLFEQVAESCDSPPWIQSQSQYYQALLVKDQRVYIPVNEEAQLFIKLASNTHTSGYKRVFAKMHYTCMIYYGRLLMKNRYKHAFALFADIASSGNSSRLTALKAQFYMAEIRILRKNNRMSIGEANEILRKVVQCKNISKKMKKRARQLVSCIHSLRT